MCDCVYIGISGGWWGNSARDLSFAALLFTLDGQGFTGGVDPEGSVGTVTRD